MLRTKAFGVRKDFSGVAQSSLELIAISKCQFSYWDYSRYSREPVADKTDLKVFPLIYFEAFQESSSFSSSEPRTNCSMCCLLSCGAQHIRVKRKPAMVFASLATTRVYRRVCRLTSSEFISRPIRHLPVMIRRRFEDVGQAGPGNICLFVVAGGDLYSSLLARSASRKRAPALASSSSHPRRVISPLCRSRPFRVYFFSVNDVPRDNGTAGACRNRHHGGGKMP